MTVIDKWGQKVPLPRANMGDLWEKVRDHYAAEDPQTWKHLAMFTLREAAGWNLEQIGTIFGHSPGHVSRCIRDVRRQLQRRFRAEPLSPRAWDLLTDPDDHSGPESTDGEWDCRSSAPKSAAIERP